MQVCHAWRISHDDFLRWSKRSRDHAIWYLARVNSTCQTCGTRPEEWDDDHGGIRAYVWDLDQCRGCEVKSQGDDHLAKANDPKRSSSPYPRGTYVTMRRNEEVW
jgi:hypothetical protein